LSKVQLTSDTVGCRVCTGTLFRLLEAAGTTQGVTYCDGALHYVRDGFWIVKINVYDAFVSVSSYPVYPRIKSCGALNYAGSRSSRTTYVSRYYAIFVKSCYDASRSL